VYEVRVEVAYYPETQYVSLMADDEEQARADAIGIVKQNFSLGAAAEIEVLSVEVDEELGE